MSHSIPSSFDATQQAALTQRLAANPGVVLEQLAESHQCTVAQAIECLPPAMWHKLAGERFVDIMNAVAQWHTPVTLITHSADAILEFTGPLPAGEISHGFFNLSGSTGLHGHLRYQNCGAIYYVERPFMGKNTASLIFCNQPGDVMFKIFAGRDEQGQLRQEQIQALRALAKQE